MSQTIRPLPIGPDLPKVSFHRGRRSPRGVVWFGVRSFWGHLRHFLASAVAAEDVDSRDWMTPDVPARLADEIALRLGATELKGCLLESLGHDLYIDFIADTGDDVSVSTKMAELVFREYELPDPVQAGKYLKVPRGDILLFGGDTAYPVATVEEINNRVIVPFNRVLMAVDDQTRRIVLGIPGNHDWYDGLDGFARLFRRRAEDDDYMPRPSLLPIAEDQIERAADWAKQFVLGGQRHKQKRLNLHGYSPLQGASYFAIPLTQHLQLLAADRQLRQIDYRQRRFFSDFRNDNPDATPVVFLPDPVRGFGAPRPTGAAMVEALGLDLEHSAHLVVSGDIHHYERFCTGKSMHVIAGGGGAFLHPAPLVRTNSSVPDIEWPGPNQSRALLRQVPAKVMQGRSGTLPHLAYALLFAPIVPLQSATHPNALAFGIGEFVVLSIAFIVYVLIAGAHRKNRSLAAGLALPSAAATACLPAAVAAALDHIVGLALVTLPEAMNFLLTLVVAVFAGTWLFGVYLSLLTRFGLEHTQAFTALDHPGYKHFLRLRVRAETSSIDVWCIGLMDPLAEGEKPVLVDCFTFAKDGVVARDGSEIASVESKSDVASQPVEPS